MYRPTTPLAALPGHDYNQPLLPQNPEFMQMPGPPEYSGLPRASCPARSSGPAQMPVAAAAPGSVWQYGRRQGSLSGATPPTMDESSTRNTNPAAKDLSLKIISVWAQMGTISQELDDQLCTIGSTLSMRTTGSNHWTFLLLLNLLCMQFYTLYDVGILIWQQRVPLAVNCNGTLPSVGKGKPLHFLKLNHYDEVEVNS